MNSNELEKLTALPAIQDAIRAQADAIEAESLATRLASLDAYQQAGDDLAALGSQAAGLDAMQDELDRQRNELAERRAAHAIEQQVIEAMQRIVAREMRQNHGSGQASDVARILGCHAESMRREAAYLRSLRIKRERWGGGIVEEIDPTAMRKAAELERKAAMIECERAAIVALEFARLSPQAIERDIRARVAGLGFTLKTAIVQEGWRLEGCDARPMTRTAQG